MTKFTYESNNYSSDRNDEGFFENHFETVSTQEGGNDTTFSLDHDAIVFISASIDNDNPNSHTYSPNDIEMFLEKENGNPILRVKPLQLETDTFFTRFQIVLPSGNYKLKANSINESYFLSLSASFDKKVPVKNMIGAGLRIKSIATVDGNNLIKKKTFAYDINGLSTGRLVSPLKYFYNEKLIETRVYTGLFNISNSWSADYVVRNSNSIIPLGNSALGSPIGYDQVIVSETNSANESLGRTKYFYHNEEEVPTEHFMPCLLYTSPSPRD